ncbi:MAG: AAA family ATPase [Candidatus Shapirobacteria bacterium]|nr:AAA family ATPase [Candidatus Shapirobacteria bacterium]
MKFIIWQYTIGWRWYWKRVWFNLKRLFHFFSFGILLKTLLAPWKRLTVGGGVGFDIKKFFEDLSFNAISIVIGAIVRSVLIIFCLIIGILYLIVSVPFFIVWLVVPFLGWGYYERDQKRSINILKNIEKRIKSNPSQAAKIIFTSEPGNFVRGRMEKKIDEIIMSITITPESFKDFDSSSFEKIMSWFLSKNDSVEAAFQKLEMTKDDVILAAKWWDKRQLFWGLNEQQRWSLGRPGIGWGLLFGYTPNLDKYSEDLGVKQSFSHHLIGRDPIVKRMEQVINGGKNILLVGDPGVGKMTVVYEFAERAITGKLGRKLAYKKLVLLDYQMAMAGAGDKDFKKKILADLMEEAKAAGNILLVIKDLFRITNADFEGNDYADVVTKALERGRLGMIALTGRVEYERFLANDSRILKTFEVIEILPPNKDEAMLILMQAVNEVESKMKIKFSVQAMKQILEGSDKYITETPFPEKALELMDQVAINKTSDGTLVTADEVNKTLSEKTGISINRLTEGEKEKLGNLEKIISKELIGQNIAIEWIAKSLRSRIAAAKNENRPVGSFLFLGPTGVGKTQTAKVLADVYYASRKSILRFDMAEYVGEEGLMRLVGSVDKNQPGIMTTEIKNRPASLLLLDEIEKAPPEIYNLFLTMLDEGYINDAKGNKVICRHLFVVATSNAGAKFIREQVMKGIKGEELQKRVVDFVQSQGIFSPEFLNRFDGVVVFEPLEGKDLVSIAVLMLRDLRSNLLEKNINISFDDNVAGKIAKDGFNIEFGARPMRRIVDLILGDLIGKAIIENKVLPGDKIKVVGGEGKNEYRIEKIKLVS